MKKKIKIILLENNIKKENKGSIISVSRGYAFNYLIPNKMAEIATEKKIKHYNIIKNILKQKQQQYIIKIKSLTSNIQKIKKISIYKKQGESSSIFGNITEKEVLKWITQYTNLTIEKIKIQSLNTKNIGIGEINIEINQKINLRFPIYIIPTNI